MATKVTFHACGDETCAVCGKGIPTDDEVTYCRVTDRYLCNVCQGHEEDAFSDMCVIGDPRYDDTAIDSPLGL